MTYWPTWADKEDGSRICWHLIPLLLQWYLVDRYKEKKMKLFYSYSHKNEQCREDMEKHLALLKRDSKLDSWSDKKITPGTTLDNEIDVNLMDSDIICLLMSSDFIASDACMRELETAIKRKENDDILVIPIILSHCPWDDTELKKVKALPKDGKPISTFRDKEEAWKNVYDGIKHAIEKESCPEMNSEHKKFLEDTELSSILGKNVTLSDIFIPMDLRKRDFNDNRKDINFIDFVEKYKGKPENVIISGDQQSGKSALLRQMFLRLPPKYLLIYIDCSNDISTNTIHVINSFFKKQYRSNQDISYFNSKKIVLFDDFHKLKMDRRKKIIDDLKNENSIKMIITTDDIYNLGIKEQLVTKVFKHYKIKHMGQRLRDDLTCKWLEINGKNFEEETIYRDELNARIDTVVQKTIVPAYPFFIYTIIASHEIITPLDSEITSQGHCYQALIYFALRKVGATDVQIDMYINFLSELASFLYSKGNNILNGDDLNSFFEEYCKQFSISIKKETIVGNLINASILKCSSFQEYSFKYKYIYLFFLGKYFSEHIGESKKVIENIIDNLQKEENGYILIFLIHHTKDTNMLEHIELNLLCRFEKQKETTLVNSEIEYLGKYVESLEPLVIDKVIDVEGNRKKLMMNKDKEEEQINSEDSGAEEDFFMDELRKAIKTVEVAGHILKNRSGSLKTVDQIKFLEAAMDVFLRITDFFLMEFQKHEEAYVDYIGYLVSKKLVTRRGVPVLDKNRIRKAAAKIFFNINFFTCYATVRRISESLCSKELLSIMEEVCTRKSTPISYLIKKQSKMMYRGSIDVKDIKDTFENLPSLVQRLLSSLIRDHCYMHKIDYKDRAKISRVLKINERDIPIGAIKSKT